MASDKKRKLLVIDDHQSTQVLVSEILAGKGIDIIESGYGWEALQVYKKYHGEIFLVLLDLRLPDCDGTELINKLRQEDLNIPIIAMSALPISELSEKCRGYGFNAYISKPFDICQFLQVINQYL